MARPRILFLTLWGYPFGGGEDFMYQSMAWFSDWGYDVYWISFSSQKSPYKTFEFIEEPGRGFRLHVPGGWKNEYIAKWIWFLTPVAIHHQGARHIDAVRVAKDANIPCITGFHFWSDAVRLQEPWRNQNILENSRDHCEDGDFPEIMENALVYAASEFVVEVVEAITHRRIRHVVYPSPDVERSTATDVRETGDVDLATARFVTLVNCHRLKGGEVLLELIREMPHIPFLAIRTEDNSEILDEEIRQAMARQKTLSGVESFIEERNDDIRTIMDRTRIVLAPSKVDETFFRVGMDAALSKRPIISSGAGNMRYMFQNCEGAHVARCDAIPEWVDYINEWYSNEPAFRRASAATIDITKRYSETVAKAQMRSLVELTRTTNAVMVFAMWGDQGLGTQARDYVHILENRGFTCCIFSYKPYYATPNNPRHQKNPNEWAHPRVYYSPNTREATTDQELIQFVQQYNVKVCLVPETVNDRCFTLPRLLRTKAINCISMPNIEIVRRDEIMFHKYYTLNLANNFHCANVFKLHGISNTEYLGYGVKEQKPVSEIGGENQLRILAVGGMTALSRKQVHILAAAVVHLYEHGEKTIKATITLQGGSSMVGYENIEPYINHPAITVIASHLTIDEVEKLHYDHDVYFMQSRKEGLGLGFYKALEYNLPVITLDTPPHNEIIVDGVNGFVMKVLQFEPMTDNADGFVQEAVADPLLLQQKLVEILNMRRDGPTWKALISSLREDVRNRLSWENFTTRLASAVKRLGGTQS